MRFRKQLWNVVPNDESEEERIRKTKIDRLHLFYDIFRIESEKQRLVNKAKCSNHEDTISHQDEDPFEVMKKSDSEIKDDTAILASLLKTDD